jgi:hypothetical protein
MYELEIVLLVNLKKRINYLRGYNKVIILFLSNSATWTNLTETIFKIIINYTFRTDISYFF